MNVLGKVVEDIKAQRPDHIVMTGDIGNLGLRSEYPIGSAWLASIGGPESVSFVPGNHDAYVRSTVREILPAFGPWMQGDSTSQKFPYVRRRGNVALIGLNSAIPTAPFLASGSLGSGQLARLALILRAAKTAGLARVILIHHPPHRTGAKIGRGLRDAARLETILSAEGAELVLHGHNHHMSITWLASKHGPIPVAGVASASLRTQMHGLCAGYRLFRIEQCATGWEIGMRTRQLASNGNIVDVSEQGHWQILVPDKI